MKMLFSIGLLLLSLAAQAAMTNTLTYAASLGKVVAGDRIEEMTNVTAAVEMTVALYPDKDGVHPLWCRRFAADIEAGRFAVILSDDNGTDVSATELSHPATYGTLADLFARVRPSVAVWVEVSNVREDGKLLSDVASPLPRGKLTASPYAVVAECAESAHGSFTVRGTATVAGLEALGDFYVATGAVFASTVTFKQRAEFGPEGLTVTGTVSKTKMDGVGTLVAGALTASSALEVGTLTVNSSASTRLTSSPQGFKPPQVIRVADAFAVGTALAAEEVDVGSLVVTGKFTMQTACAFGWPKYGTLVVPGGVYEADDRNRNLKAFVPPSDVTYWNETGKNVLLTYVVGTAADVTRRGEIGGKPWVKYGMEGKTDIGIDLTTLFPLRNGEKATAKTVLSQYVKELSK